MPDPFWRLLTEPYTTLRHIHNGIIFVSIHFADVCTVPVYPVEIEAVRREHQGLAENAGQGAEADAVLLKVLGHVTMDRCAGNARILRATSRRRRPSRP